MKKKNDNDSILIPWEGFHLMTMMKSLFKVNLKMIKSVF